LFIVFLLKASRSSSGYCGVAVHHNFELEAILFFLVYSSLGQPYNFLVELFDTISFQDLDTTCKDGLAVSHVSFFFSFLFFDIFKNV